ALDGCPPSDAVTTATGIRDTYRLARCCGLRCRRARSRVAARRPEPRRVETVWVRTKAMIFSCPENPSGQEARVSGSGETGSGRDCRRIRMWTIAGTHLALTSLVARARTGTTTIIHGCAVQAGENVRRRAHRTGTPLIRASTLHGVSWSAHAMQTGSH